MPNRSITALVIGLALAAAASCAGEPETESPPRTTARVCVAQPAGLDELDHALHRCADDAGCPCGSRCAPVGVCTYDCRVDRVEPGCAAGLVCDSRGRCAEADRVEVSP